MVNEVSTKGSQGISRCWFAPRILSWYNEVPLNTEQRWYFSSVSYLLHQNKLTPQTNSQRCAMNCISYICATYCSVTKLCLTLCDSMNFSTPGFPVLHYRCSNSCSLSWWCHPTISFSVSPFSSCPQSFSASGSFPMSRLFSSSGRSTGASASASVLPMNIQSWFPLGLTDLISLLSLGLSKVFSSTPLPKSISWTLISNVLVFGGGAFVK